MGGEGRRKEQAGDGGGGGLAGAELPWGECEQEALEMLSLKVANGAEGSGTPAAGQDAAPPDGRSLPKRAGSEGLGAQQPAGEYRGPPAFVWGWEVGWKGGEDTRDTPFG